MNSSVQFLTLLILVSFVRCTVALVDHYAISTSISFSIPVDHWATFDTTYGNLSSASYYDDNTNLDPIDFCMPFFQLPNARMYISSNGFLSPAPFALCKYFCSSYADGDYQFNNWGDGGDWPLVGLFVDDMNPLSTVSPASSGIFKRTGQKVVLGEVIDMALVFARCCWTSLHYTPSRCKHSDGQFVSIGLKETNQNVFVCEQYFYL